MTMAAAGLKKNSSTYQNDTLQYAIDRLTSQGGGVLEFDGIIKTGGLIIPKNNVILQGVNPYSSIIMPYGRINAFKALNTLAGMVQGASFRNFAIDGTNQSLEGQSYDSSFTKAFFVAYMRNCRWENLYVHHTGATGVGCDYLDNCEMRGVVAEYCGRLATVGAPGASGIGVGTGRLSNTTELLNVFGGWGNFNKNYGFFTESQVNAADTADPGYKNGQEAMVRGIKLLGFSARGNNIGIADSGGDGSQYIACYADDNAKANYAVDRGTLSRGIGRNILYSGCRSFNAGKTTNNGGHGFLIEAPTATSIMDGIQILGAISISDKGDGVHISKHNSAIMKNIIIDEATKIEKSGNDGVSLSLTGTGTIVPFSHLRISPTIISPGQNKLTYRNGLRVSGAVTKSKIINMDVDDEIENPDKTMQNGVLLEAEITDSQIMMNAVRGGSLANWAGTSNINASTDVKLNKNLANN